MNKFYHISKTDLSGINEFNLIKTNDEPIAAVGLHTALEFEEYKNSLYPDGISSHGWVYLHSIFCPDGPSRTFSPNVLMVETAFELVRRYRYPQRSSRFTSWYACLTMEDALKTKETLFDNQGSIYKVACDKYFKADLNFIQTPGSVIGLQIIAEKYWKGKSSTKPFWEVVMEPPIRILEKVG